MRTITAVAFSLLFVAAAAGAAIQGAWTAEPVGDGSLQVQLSSGRSNHGETMSPADFTGLSSAAIRATSQTPVNFELRREAGTVAFEGTFKNGFGAGQFTFTANPDYRATLHNLGVSWEDRSAADEREFLVMALLDVSTDFIRAMQAEGYRVSAEKYVAMKIFRVTPQYVRDMRAAGYANLSADDLISSRIHNATPEFASEMASLGYTDIPFQKLVACRIHRVTPDFIREMKDEGYERIPLDKLISMRIHGVDATFVRRMNGAKD